MNAIHMYMICQCFLHECHILRGAVSENCHEMAIFSFSFFFLFRGDIFSHILAIINRRVWIGSLADPQAEDPSLKLLKLAGLPGGRKQLENGLVYYLTRKDELSMHSNSDIYQSSLMFLIGRCNRQQRNVLSDWSA